ncbi:MAG: hypothetical protein PHQ34_06600 [Methanothrix sp.]|nr:hypothetical protein [Methanothrix sp.]
MILIVQMASGIEVDFSMNDLDLNSQYDVDNSVYVYEEASANPLPTTICDYRDVHGNGKINLKQVFSSHNYAAASGTKADSGSVQSTALLTSTDLSVTQRANLAGSLAESFLTGYQNYMGGMAFTGQYLRVENGILNTVQTLSLGRSIYSSQDFQASGVNPLAVGYALVASQGSNSFDAQGAFIVAGACREGSIRGSMGAEVVKVPDTTAIDPIAYGSRIDAQGDEGAGIIAGAGALKGDWLQNPFASYLELDGQGALAGAVGIGENSRASVDYIQAQTDGKESSAFEADAKAKGDDAAIVAAGAGNFKLQNAFGFRPYGPIGGPQFGPAMAFYSEDFDLQGSIIGAAGIGDDSKAKAGYVGAITDGSRTLAMGGHLKAEGNGLALVGAAAGCVGYGAEGYYYRTRHDRLQLEFEGLGVEGALALAAGAGEDSKASADFMAAGTDGGSANAFAADARARGDYLATVLAGAGSLYAGRYEYDRDSHHDDYYRSGESLDVQGALAGALGIGDHSSASADFIATGTNGDRTNAFAADARARGDDAAAVLAATGNLHAGSYEYDRDSHHDDYSRSGEYLGAQGALAGALGIGDHSSASADFIAAGTNEHSTYAYAADARARGDDAAAVLAAAGNLHAGSYEYDRDSHHGDYSRSSEYLGVQGALAGALGIGDHSSASADFIAAGTNEHSTYAYAADANARGNDWAAVLAAAGNLHAGISERGINGHNGYYAHDTFTNLDAQAALAGALGVGDHSSASADFIAAGTNGDSTEAFAADARARGDDAAAVLAAAGSVYWNNLAHECNGPQGHSYSNTGNFGGQGALAGALGAGDHSSASVDFIKAGTNGQQTFALMADSRAHGDDLATVLAAAGAIDGKYDAIGNSIDLGAQGSIVGSLGAGDHSCASADFMGASTDYDHSTAFACDLKARGNSFAAVGAGAGSIQLEISPPNTNVLAYQGSAVGAYSFDSNSYAYAHYIRSCTSWDRSSAFAKHIGSGPNGEVFAGVAHPSAGGGIDGVTAPSGSYNQAYAGVDPLATPITYWGIS